MKKVKASMFSMVVAAGVLAGCGAEEEAAVEQETGGDVEATEEIKVAMILKTLSNPYWTAMEEGILEEAETLGVEVETYASQSESDLQGQLRIYEDLLGQDFDGIGFAPLSPVNLIQPTVDAYENGIVTVNIDEKVDMEALKAAGGNVGAFVTTDNVEVGRQAAQFIVDEIGEGQVAIIEGKAGNASGEARRSGAEEIFTASEGIELVDSQPADWDRDKALTVASNLLQRYPDLSAIYAANDTMALGALQAVENAGLSEQVIVVGTDGQPEAIDSVENGGLAATVAQDSAEIGRESLRLLVAAVEEGDVIGMDEEPTVVTVPSYIVSE